MLVQVLMCINYKRTSMCNECACCRSFSWPAFSFIRIGGALRPWMRSLGQRRSLEERARLQFIGHWSWREETRSIDHERDNRWLLLLQERKRFQACSRCSCRNACLACLTAFCLLLAVNYRKRFQETWHRFFHSFLWSVHRAVCISSLSKWPLGHF